MSEPKFTPGPWVHEGRPPNLRVVFAGETPGSRPAPCVLMDGDQEANAHLIAAAPDLYEALATLLTTLRVTDENGLTQFIQSVSAGHAALAKARGK